MEVSSSTSANQVEVPDTTQSSPLSITSDVADSPALAIGAGLSQSAAVFMSEVTTLTGESVYSASHTHLLASAHESAAAAAAGILLAVAPESQRFAAFPGGVGLGEGGELVLSSSLDSGGGVSLPETTMTFDPDCFLNNPKQGQTYGGGGGKAEGCNGDDSGGGAGGGGGLHCSSNGFVYNPALVGNIKTEATAAMEATQSSYVGEGAGLSPSTTLEQMDFSAVMSSACVPSLGQPAHHPSPSLFLQASPQTARLQVNGTEATQEQAEPRAYVGLTAPPPPPTTDPPVTNGDPRGHHRQASTEQQQQGSHSRNGQATATSPFPIMPQDTVAEEPGGGRRSGDLDETSDNGGGEAGDPHEAFAVVDTEHYLQPNDNGGSGGEEGGGDRGAGGGGGGGGGVGGESEILCNGVSLSGSGGSVVASPQSLAAGATMEGALYSSGLPQQAGAGVSTSAAEAGGAAISLEGFEASFGSQFSDLINDFISVEGSAGGVGAAVTGVLMPQEGATGDEQGAGPAHLQGSEVEQGALGLLQETGRLFSVTDYSPEWSYPEGGVKVLITGPWLESSSEYSCLFDHISVPAALIQPGVLRCYCPAHDTGLVMLQVAMGGEVISSSVVFEYKARDLPALPSSQHDWLSLDDTQFRMSILERLEQMEQRMAEITNQNPNSETSATKSGAMEGGGGPSDQQSQVPPDQGSFEGRVVVVCEKMMSQPCWASSTQLVHSKNSRGMTLLHLAAAQGYAGLIQTLIRWRTKHADSIDLELEVDPLNVDHFSCTPLMWACALGHTEAALVLYQWDPRALAIPDSLGRLPLNIARSRGHTRLAELLEQLQHTPQAPSQPSDNWMDRWRGESQTSGMNNSPTPNHRNPELKRARRESQTDNQSSNWSQSRQRAQQGPQGDQGGTPPAKRLKPNQDTQQQLANSVPAAYTLSSLLNSSPNPNLQRSLPVSAPPQTQPPTLSCQNAPPASSSPHRPQIHSAPLSHLQARLGGGARWRLRQTLGQRSLARRIQGKERLAVHLRQSLLSDMGEETELLTYQDNTEDLQMDITMLADHIMEASTCGLKQGAREAESDSGKVGIGSDVRFLSGYLSEVERFLNSKPQSPSPKPNPLAGPADQQSPQAKQALSFPSEWNSFLSAALKEERLKMDSSCLSMTETEQGELYETIRHALHSLRKHKGPVQDQRREIAAVIQRCYKRYKQYALYKRMTLAAILIQSRFRSFHEQKKFQQSRRAAVLIQQYYRSYRHSLSSLLTKKQNQAARKILRFLLRCRHSPLMDHRPLKRGQRAEKGQGS